MVVEPLGLTSSSAHSPTVTALWAFAVVRRIGLSMVATSKHKVNIFMRFFLIAIYFSPLDGYVKRAAYSSPPRTACSPKRTATLQAIFKMIT
jgi:hypothetical protein